MGNEGAIHVLPLVSEFTARKGTSLATTGYESLYCAQATRVAYMKEEQSSPPHTMLHSARHTRLLRNERGLLRNWTFHLFLAIQSFAWLLKHQTKDPVQHSNNSQFPCYRVTAMGPAPVVREEQSVPGRPGFMKIVF